MSEGLDLNEKREVFALVILHAMITGGGASTDDLDAQLAVRKAEQLLAALSSVTPHVGSGTGSGSAS